MISQILSWENDGSEIFICKDSIGTNLEKDKLYIGRLVYSTPTDIIQRWYVQLDDNKRWARTRFY